VALYCILRACPSVARKKNEGIDSGSVWGGAGVPVRTVRTNNMFISSGSLLSVGYGRPHSTVAYRQNFWLNPGRDTVTPNERDTLLVASASI
jgi:hypothetical protein